MMNNRDRRWYQSRVHQLEKRIAELELQAQQMDDAYKSLQDMLFKAEQRIAELESALEFEMNTTRDAIKEKNQRIERLEKELSDGKDRV